MASATTFSDLLAHIMVDLPKCPTVLALQHLQQSARKFCEKSEAWQVKLDAINLVAEQVDYTLTPEFNAEIRRIAEVWIRTDSDVTDGLDGKLLDFDKYDFEPIGSVLTLADSVEPSAAVTDGLVVKVVLVPNLTTDVDTLDVQGGITATFLNYWAESIMAGAKYTLMRFTSRPWSDPRAAMMYLNDFNAGVSKAKTEIEGLKYRSEQDGFGA
jgi:hypothetical protein